MHRRPARLLLAGILAIAGSPAEATAQDRPVAPDVAEWIHRFETTPDTTTPAARAEQLFRDACRAFGCVGASMAVARDGELVFSTAYGMADLEGRVPARPNTVYNVGSVSKVMTAVAMMQLVEEGRVHLDDDIRSWVPSFPDKGRTITVWHMLTHTSGIRHYRDSDFPHGVDGENVQRFTDVEDAYALFADDSLLFEPGTMRSYSSYAVNLLQGVIERASGMDFEAYMRARVWGPAGMRRTAFDRPLRITPGRARGYLMVDGEPVNHPYEDVTYKFASGGMLSTAEDLVRFAMAFNDGRLLRPETVREMIRPQLDGVPEYRPRDRPADREEKDERQALMWNVAWDGRYFEGSGPGRMFVVHGGSVKGFGAALVLDPEADLAVAICANNYNAPAFELLIAELFRRP
jgi:serine beta-lactamase-like protein LACTB